MDRLTVNDLNKVCYDPWELCGMDGFCTKRCHEEGGCTKGCKILKMYRKLAEYEDLEEQGLLLKPLCKVGDTVYVLFPEDSHFEKAQIDRIEIKPTIFGKVRYYIEPVAYRGSLYRYYENDFGKTVFLTQAEAEEALKKTEGK